MLLGGGAMVAQDMPSGPPKVLVIQREWTKPGKGGAIHEKSESNFVNAMTAAKWPTHYFAAESMSGKPRVLFFVGYPSFEAWEKDNKAQEKNATLSAALDRAELSDGELLDDYQQDVLLFDPDLSLNTGDNGGVYLAISKMASLAENDQFMGDDKKFTDAMGSEKMKKVRELMASSVESEMTNLYEFKPSMSYADESWIKADAFWKSKAAAPVAKKAAAGQ
jgi:hypothetical protein